jgi:hypothetical protein
MSEQGIGMMVSVVVVSFIVLLSIVSLTNMEATAAFNPDVIKYITEKPDVPVISGDYNDVDNANLFYNRPKDLPMTAVEINCIIAQDIRYYFEQYGTNTQGEDLTAGGIGITRERLLGIGRFKLESKWIDLTAIQKDQVAEACRMDVEENFLVGFNTDKCDNTISEQCVTQMLSHMVRTDPITGETASAFCNKTFVPSGGGLEVMFGNDNCGEGTSCDEYCPGGDMITVFKAVDKENIEYREGSGCEVDPAGEFVEDIKDAGDNIADDLGDIGDAAQDTNQTPTEWVNNVVDETSDFLFGGHVIIKPSITGNAITGITSKFGNDMYLTRETLNTTSISTSAKKYDYIYSLTWGSDDKKYKVRIFKVPALADYTEDGEKTTSPYTIAADLNRILSLGIHDDEFIKYYQRSRDEGWKVPELRIAYQLKFTASEDMRFGEFLEEALPERWTRYIVPCSDCSSPTEKIVRIRWFQEGRKIGTDINYDKGSNFCDHCWKNEICKDVGGRGDRIVEAKGGGEQYSPDNLYIYTPLDPYLENTTENRANIIKNHTYKIVFHNWVYNHYQQLGESDNTDGTWMKKRILETIQDVSITIVDITGTEPTLDDLIQGLPDTEEQKQKCINAGGFVNDEQTHCSEGSSSASNSCPLGEFYLNMCTLDVSPEPFEDCENGGSYGSMGEIICN